MRNVMHGVRFLLELSLLASVAYWGLQLDRRWPVRIVLGLGAPVAVATVWGRYVAPRSPRLLADPKRFGVELALFGLGSAAWFAAGSPVLGTLLLALFLVNRLSLRTLPE
jgi:hypothetical protein